jgi:hypothetical protein
LKPSKLTDLKPNKKCCRSRPRCKKCPVVVHQVRSAEHNGIRGKQPDEGVQAGPKLLIIPSYSGVPWCYPAGEREGGGYVGL